MRETDIVSGSVKSTERDGGAEEAVESGLILDESCSGILFTGLDGHTEDWSVEPHCRLNDSESEEVLNAINPNEMYTSALSESDSGLSEDQYSDEQNHSSGPQPPALYQVVYDISGVGGAIAEQQPPHMDVISIELGERFLFLRLNDSESEEVLNAINPNEMYTSALSESDSGLSEDQYSDEQNHSSGPQPPALYQVVYDISGVGGAIAEQQPPHMDVISIELDEWSSQMLLSESCVVNELVSSVKVENASTHDMQNVHNPDSFLVYPDLQLTEEEQKLLDQEGISLPNNLPLTKAEERILKKVRRKIRNKLSAQDSRRRKKEYIDGLESRVAACSAQNKELLRTVNQLEKHNMSLMAQLHKLQALIKQTATKAAQTSTCVMILIFSLALLIFPSYSPFSRRSQSLEDGYAPSGVISRNILNDAGSPALLEDVGEDEPMVSAPAELKLSDADWDSDGPQPPEEASTGEQRNGTAASGADADTLSAAAGNAGADAAKPPHADEM